MKQYFHEQDIMLFVGGVSQTPGDANLARNPAAFIDPDAEARPHDELGSFDFAHGNKR